MRKFVSVFIFAYFLATSTLVAGAPGEDCSDVEPCQAESEQCENEKCICKLEYVSNENGDECLKIATLYGEECDEDVQCEGKIGVEVKDMASCTGNPLTTCQCNFDNAVRVNIEDPPYSACWKKIDDFDETCTHDEQCNWDDDKMTCESTETESLCKCKDGVEADSFGCLPLRTEVGELCSKPEQCQNLGIEESYDCLENPDDSSESVCTCKDPDFIASVNKDKCLPRLPLDADAECEEDEQCIAENAYCNRVSDEDLQRKCQCKSGFTSSENKCLKLRTDLGETCEIQEQCTANIEHSECDEDSQCKCIEDAIPHPNNKACLIKATGLGDSCEIDDQCVDQKNAACLRDRDGGELKCLCDGTNFVANPDDNQCYIVSNIQLTFLKE